MEENGIRINKYLSDQGICSRREADRQVSGGNVLVNGHPAQMGERVFLHDEIVFCGKKVEEQAEKKVILAFHKPQGIVCTTEKREKNNIVDYIHYPIRVYPVGRLDKDSEGLIFLTNDGDIVNRLMRAGNRHEKEYVVTTDKEVTASFLKGMSGGVPLMELGVTTRPCTVKKLGKHQFSIILTQGYNRQIRRMCEYFGYRVRKLVRIRIMNVLLGDLKIGTYRTLTPEEEATLRRKLLDSSNTTVVKEKGHGSDAKCRNIKS